MWTWLQQFPGRQSSHKRPEHWAAAVGAQPPAWPVVHRAGGWGSGTALSGRQAGMSEHGNSIMLISSAWGKSTLRTILCVCRTGCISAKETHSCQCLLTEQALTGLLGRDKSGQGSPGTLLLPSEGCSWTQLSSSLLVLPEAGKKPTNPRCLNQQSTSSVEANKAIYCRLVRLKSKWLMCFGQLFVFLLNLFLTASFAVRYLCLFITFIIYMRHKPNTLSILTGKTVQWSVSLIQKQPGGMIAILPLLMLVLKQARLSPRPTVLIHHRRLSASSYHHSDMMKYQFLANLYFFPALLMVQHPQYHQRLRTTSNLPINFSTRPYSLKEDINQQRNKIVIVINRVYILCASLELFSGQKPLRAEMAPSFTLCSIMGVRNDRLIKSLFEIPR